MARVLCICLLFFSTLSLGGWMWAALRIPRRIRGRCYSEVEETPRHPVALVLGCTRHLRSGRPNLYFAHRIDAAAALYQAGKVERLLVSGASHRGEVDEAMSMKQALVEQGVGADAIICDHHGYRTIDSVLRAARVYGYPRIAIVSQRFHNERAIYIAERSGIEAIGFDARDVAPPHGRLVRFREFFARLRVLLDLHVFGTQPRHVEEVAPRSD